MNMSKFDESFIIMSTINIEQTIQKLKNKWNIKFSKNEIEYYEKNLSINKIQKKLIFNFFGKEFGNIRDEYSLTKKNYIKLLIILKKMLGCLGFEFMQHILSGVMHTNPNIKKLSKKEITSITKSDIYQSIKEKYKSTFEIISDEKVFFNTINTIISSRVLLVDYNNKENTSSEINIKDNRELVIYEFLKFVDMI